MVSNIPGATPQARPPDPGGPTDIYPLRDEERPRAYNLALTTVVRTEAYVNLNDPALPPYRPDAAFCLYPHFPDISARWQLLKPSYDALVSRHEALEASRQSLHFSAGSYSSYYHQYGQSVAPPCAYAPAPAPPATVSSAFGSPPPASTGAFSQPLPEGPGGFPLYASRTPSPLFSKEQTPWGFNSDDEDEPKPTDGPKKRTRRGRRGKKHNAAQEQEAPGPAPPQTRPSPQQTAQAKCGVPAGRPRQQNTRPTPPQTAQQPAMARPAPAQAPPANPNRPQITDEISKRPSRWEAVNPKSRPPADLGLKPHVHKKYGDGPLPVNVYNALSEFDLGLCPFTFDPNLKLRCPNEGCCFWREWLLDGLERRWADKDWYAKARKAGKLQQYSPDDAKSGYNSDVPRFQRDGRVFTKAPDFKEAAVPEDSPWAT
ncbi:hypothetical protein BU26DRAFT_518866 [Trematosphaeria pertusa]|uniref:Uncharacterized protein n=1 Tax=Trematosphaeria pertusa TaxID=390896 RepID=A0A6A6IDJ7_9PLEO|nr:uncharacterized protein BU26DRAFT_518866 [Trematosphaeria pertusa]KAF2248645.1 hypothetical protein BU26DRAFT_518866 [Trematosphaeria pertusa]